MTTALAVSRSALWLTFSLLAVTDGRTDTIILTNGDQLTGEIQQVSDGKLSLQTAYAGKLSIDWKAVDQLTTDGVVEIETYSGQRYRGKIQPSSQGFQITLGDDISTIKPQAVVALSIINRDGKPGFREQWEGNIAVGYNLTRGNSKLTQSSLDFDAEYRKRSYKVLTRATSIFGRQDATEATSRQSARIRYDKFLGARLLTFALSTLERNDRKRLALRSTAGGGFGWRLKKSQRSELSVLGGITFTNEQFQTTLIGPAPATSSGEGLLGFGWNTTSFDRVHFTGNFSFRPSLGGSGRYRIEYDSSFRIPIISHFTWNLSLFDRFDSAPLSTVQRNDYGIVTAFGFTF